MEFPLTPVVVGAAALAPMIGYDCWQRRVPNWMTGGLALLAVVGSFLGLWAWSWWGLVVGLGFVILADAPGGDVKAVAVLGGVIGAEGIAIVTALALVVTWGLAVMKRLWTWPWLPLLGASFALWALLFQGV